jgi:hypothetical protein
MFLKRDDIDVHALNSEKNSAISLAKKLEIPEKEEILALIHQHKSYGSEADSVSVKGAGQEVGERRRGRPKGSKNQPKPEERSP